MQDHWDFFPLLPEDDVSFFLVLPLIYTSKDFPPCKNANDKLVRALRRTPTCYSSSVTDS